MSIFFFSCNSSKENIGEQSKQNEYLQEESDIEKAPDEESEKKEESGDSDTTISDTIVSGDISTDTRERTQRDNSDNLEDIQLKDFIILYADGSGDYPTLPEAIDNIIAGGTIFLNPGTYILENPLQISKPIRLIGSGMEETFILCDKQDYVIRYTGTESFFYSLVLYLENISFQHEGTEWADVIQLSGGEIIFYNCSFTGAVHIYDEEEIIWGGVGVSISESTKGVIQNCTASENSVHGICLMGKANVTLNNNHCGKNGDVGIFYLGESAGIAEGNECFLNGLQGISVLERAKPSLIGNVCKYSEHSGILYCDYATGIADQNICFENGYSGITVSDNSTPTLTKNNLRDNMECGIYFDNNSGGIASYNECTGNEWGIFIESGANPLLEDNICTDNTYNLVDER